MLREAEKARTYQNHNMNHSRITDFLVVSDHEPYTFNPKGIDHTRIITLK